jgi:HSP20 family molecular chaperone IbpA
MNHLEQDKMRSQVRESRRVTGSYLSFHRSHVYSLFDELIHKPWGCFEWQPPADIVETEEAFVIEMDLPGVESNDVDVQVQHNVLIVRGKRQMRSDEKTIHLHLQERIKGQFTRVFEFERELDEDQIERSWRNGVLILRVAKVKDK